MPSTSLIALLGLFTLSSSQVITDPGVSGPPLELIHLYYDEWPTGITVSRSGRMFSNYPPGLDVNNTNTGSNKKYTVAELTSNSTEKPYPNLEWNSPPGGAINYTTTPPTGANYQTHLIGVQSVVLDPLDRLWILDTGRALTPEGVLVPSSPGGPKLVCVNITTDTVTQTILFPPTVAYPVSYLNDVRFDLRRNLSGTSGKGVAYITDSSGEGRNGIIIVDLGTGESWRHLDSHPSVHPEPGFVPFVWGTPVYYIPSPGAPVIYMPLGSDGIAISADGEDLYWGSVAGRRLYSIPTERLRDKSQNSELLAQGSVKDHGERGVSDGFETDTSGHIYTGNIENGGINSYDPKTGMVSIFVRDPRINWVDTMSVSSDGYLYFTTNQLFLLPSAYPGTDRRQRPFALFRVKLPNHGSRVCLVD
ncbi:major royal jelly protein [Delitschia confertaspora ATCC 74209]|uniref:Major royal jelly protein n=1 Tax=Delitschia confertaspora ATCC 74209 TaxID=1513339 RepID=A0A9P4JYG4_9PLEO|nr:major royal jelly protein [Delitschia confertaspora ATCC 74209]